MSKHETLDAKRTLTVAATLRAPPGMLPSFDRSPSDSVACKLGDGACASAHGTALQRRRAASGESAVHASLLRLQRDYGNQFVGKVLRQTTDHEDGHDGTGAVEHSIGLARGGGQPMDHALRGSMERSFGADFSGVRIHTDSRAHDLSEAISARAFATGNDVFFRQSEYNPGTSTGRELIAHELTHVVQQGGAAIRAKMSVSQPGDPSEVEADHMAKAVVAAESASLLETPVPSGR